MKDLKDIFNFTTDSERYQALLRRKQSCRLDTDRAIDDFIKRYIVSGQLEYLHKFFENDDLAIDEAVNDFNVIRDTKGIYIDSGSERIPPECPPDGYRTLCEGELKKLSFSARNIILTSVLNTIERLGRSGIYPGAVTLDSIIYRTSDKEEISEVCIRNVHRFQLGPFRHTWEIYLNPDTSPIGYPYLNEDLQQACNKIIAARILVCHSDNLSDFESKLQSANLTDRIKMQFSNASSASFGAACLSPERIRSGKIAVCTVIPACVSTHHEQRFYKQINIIKNCLSIAAARKPDLELYEGYTWAGFRSDTLNGRSAIGIRPFAPFDSMYLPNLQTCGTVSEKDPDYLLQAYIAADTMIQLLPDDYHAILFILHPEENSTAIIKSASFARNLDDRASVVYLHEGDLNGRDSVTQFNTSEEHRERGITALSGFILSECGVSEE